MLMESLYEVGMIAVDAMHCKRRQYEARLGGRLDICNRRQNRLVNTSISCPRSTTVGWIAISFGKRPLESAKFDIGDKVLCRKRRLHAVVLVQQIPQRLVDTERARDIA